MIFAKLRNKRWAQNLATIDTRNISAPEVLLSVDCVAVKGISREREIAEGTIIEHYPVRGHAKRRKQMIHGDEKSVVHGEPL